MKRLSPFLAGMLTTAVIGSLAITGLAASSAVTFNTVNLTFSGKPLSAAGEDFTLSSGASVPASITYTDENGGGTTYLPVARLGELLGVQIGWDQNTKSVKVGEAVDPPPTTPPADETPTTPPADAWTAEEEAAYQEFKGMWEIEQEFSLRATYSGTLSWDEFKDAWNSNIEKDRGLYEKICCRMVTENNPNASEGRGILLDFYFGEKYLSKAAVYSNGETHCYLGTIK